MSTLTLHLDQFEGPLDLLLFLVGKAKIDIKDIFISDITEQYIAAVNAANTLDMDDASDFIRMASTLLQIKSRALLPRPEPLTEDDPEVLLIRQLEEYAALKEVAQEMKGFEAAAAKIYEKLPEEYPLPPQTFELTGLSLEGLTLAFANVLERFAERNAYEALPTSRSITREEYTVPQLMGRILKELRHHSVSFVSLLSEDTATRQEVVTLFLAVLELLRTGKIECKQNHTYDDIIIQKTVEGRR